MTKPKLNSRASRTHGDFVAIVRRAENGDKTAMPEIRRMLSEPNLVELLGGDLAGRARQTLILRFTRKNLLSREALNRKLELLCNELSGSNPLPTERLLVESVLTCWLHVYYLEMDFAAREDMSIALGLYFQRSITLAQRRYLAAIKMLAIVRKLAVPTLQLASAKVHLNAAENRSSADKLTTNRPVGWQRPQQWRRGLRCRSRSAFSNTKPISS